jgi:hypothetical protein
MAFSGSGAASGAAAGSAFGPWGTVIGGLIGAFATQKKTAPVAPFVPVKPIDAPTPVDAAAEQKKALAGNLASQGDIESLLSRSNKYQQGQASSLLEQAVPGYGKLSASILSRGQQAADHPYDLPPEVQANLSRIAAERGISVGNRGQSQQFSALKDLGVNMLDYGNQNFQRSLQALQTVTGLAPRVSPMSPLSFYLTPGQTLGNAQQNVNTGINVATTNANIARGNNSGQQDTLQAGYNDRTAVQNWNNANLWDGLVGTIGPMAQILRGGTTSGAGAPLNV